MADSSSPTLSTTKSWSRARVCREVANSWGAEWIERRPVSKASLLYLSLRGELDPGEAAALVLATEVSADLVLMDDLPGRHAARRLELSVKGTLGVIVAAKRQGLVEAVRPLVQALQKQGARLSPRVIQRALRVAGEEDIRQTR